MIDVPINRRSFLYTAAAAPCAAAATSVQSHTTETIPSYKIVTRSAVPAKAGLPGAYPGLAVRVHSDDAVNEQENRVNAETVKKMLDAGMRELTGAPTSREAWSKFFTSQDVVGIKVNCSGAPEINSNPELVRAIIENLVEVGIPTHQIYIYDRFENQMRIVNYKAHVPEGVNTEAAEASRGSILGYDPYTYVEVNFFGEEDTRSNLMRLVSERLTKVINVPTMKEHRAAGVTGCLKNLAYGDFSNVARSHQKEKTNTYSFIGTLASVQPLRSKTVLNVMDGLRSLWHGGPFLQDPKFLFFPKQIVVGTDPVSLDHVLIEMIESKRREKGAPSIFDHSPERIKFQPELDPMFNSFIREPGHVEYAGKLGLGVFDKAQMKEKVVSL